jgi:hypothetical protein
MIGRGGKTLPLRKKKKRGRGGEWGTGRMTENDGETEMTERVGEGGI